MNKNFQDDAEISISRSGQNKTMRLAVFPNRDVLRLS